MKCLMFMVMPRDDIYIAFLPLAHVLELLAENTMMLFGIKVRKKHMLDNNSAPIIIICICKKVTNIF